MAGPRFSGWLERHDRGAVAAFGGPRRLLGPYEWVAGQGGPYRRPEGARALPVNDAKTTDSGHGGIVQIAVEHLESLVGSRAADVELQRNAGGGALYDRTSRANWRLARFRRR